jgi:conjugative transfer region protein (TIGR03748 family)
VSPSRNPGIDIMLIVAPSDRFCRHAAGAVLLTCMGMIAGCASVPASTVSPASVGVPAANPTSEPTPVIRYGRYRLVELTTDRAQQDLMQQVVDVTITAALTATVADALRYVLQWSGYQLCDGSDEARAFESLPLPAAHLRLGPLTLRDALQVLAGPAWQIQVDDLARRVCFIRRTTARSTPLNASVLTGREQSHREADDGSAPQ